jgi:LL-H family phage holin
MEEIFYKVIYDLLLLLFTVIAVFLANYIKKRIGVERIKQIEAEIAAKQELAQLAVRFVEQVYKDLHGEEKYNKAAEWLTNRIKELGLNITEEEVKGLIEAAIRTFKDTFGEEWAKTMSKQEPPA